MPGRYFGYWAIFCGFFAAVFAIACLATDRWYVIEMPGPITVSLGLRTMCIRSDFSSDSSTGNIDSTVVSTALGGGEDKCGVLRLDVERIQCPAGQDAVTADAAYSRTNTTLILAAIGAVLMAICFFLILTLGIHGDETALWAVKAAGFLFSSLSMIFCIAGMALYYNTMDFWMYCGQEFCAFWDNLSPCDSSFGYSFYFLVFAVILTFFVALSLLFGCLNAMRGAQNDEERVNRNRQDLYEQQQRDREMQQRGGGGNQRGGAAAKDPYAVGLDNTWVWDEPSGYWWSDNEQLYFDEESGHYYDGESGQWYNPDTEEWYHA